MATEQFQREHESLREILEARLDATDMATKLRLDAVTDIGPTTDRLIDHLRGLHEARFDSLDGQLIFLREYAQTQLTSVREFLTREIEASARVTAGKFEAVNTRLDERDKCLDQMQRDTRNSLRTALASAKEFVVLQNQASNAANSKTEVNFTKQIDALSAVLAAGNKALDDKITDLKTRMDSGEGRQGGARASRAERRDDFGQIIATVAVFLTLVGLLIAVAWR